MASDIQDGKVFFNTGLDRDSNLLAIEGGDSRYRLNVTLTEDGEYEVLSNIQGNVLRSYSLPAGNNTIKGFVEDKENKAGIYFVHNSSNAHSIIRFNSEDNSFTEILRGQSSVLPLFPWDGFAGADIIGNEDEQFLIWADGREPHMINIKYAIDGNYGTLGTVVEEEISFYKRPLFTSGFLSNFTAEYVAGSSDNRDLSNRIFQFAFRLKYFDNTFSTFSNYSEIPFPIENIPSGKNSAALGYELIRITYDIGNQPTVVDKIQLLYRIVDVDEGVPGSWYVYGERDYTSIGNDTWDFMNDQSIGIISDQEAARPYDYVPDLANHVGLIDSNRAVFDVGREGYDNLPSLSVSFNTSESSISTADEGIAYSLLALASVGNPVTVTFTLNSTIDYYYEIQIDLLEIYTLYTFGLDPIDVYTEFKTWADGLALPGLSTSVTANSITFTTTGTTRTITALVLERTKTFRTLKTGAKYKFGVEYGYDGKRGPVQTSDDFILELPAFSAITSTYTDYILETEITLNHAAPTGATDFRIVSFGSNIDYFEEYFIFFNWTDITDSSSDYTIYLDEPYTVIKKDEIVNRMRAAYGDSTTGIEYGFDFQPGDVVSFVGYFETIPALTSAAAYDVNIQSVNDYVIEVVTSTEIKISSSAIREIKNLSSSALFAFWLIQIIRKKDTFDAVAQEFSLSMDISEHGNAYNITDHFSDVWKTKQVYFNGNNFADYGLLVPFGKYAWMEKPKISLYYDSRPTSQGRVNAVNEFATQRSDRRIRWGGNFIDEAGINFLTKFDFEDERSVDDRNGAINKIQQIGNVLKVYQERKVTSFYLKTTSSIDADGNDTFVFSSDVMSIGRQSIDDYGCTHFTSYVKNVRNAYFFDIVNGVVVRDSANGFQEISNNKMHTYFKDKSKEILQYTAGTVNVFGGWDEDLNMYLITFVDLANLSASVNETVGFHEMTNRWVSFYSFLPEYYGKVSGDQLLSFRDGALYEHNIGATRNNFYGADYDSEVWVHANKEAVINKVFDSIEINSVGQWSCPDDDSIVIEFPINMQSRLLAGKFKRQEGIYRSDFLRDSLNGGSLAVRNNLFNGRQLRGKEMTIKLKNSDTDKAMLESVLIRSSISK